MVEQDGGRGRGPGEGGAATAVTWEEARSRYELRVDGELVGVADVVDAGGALVMPHTEIDPAQRGRGLGEVLVRAALDDVRARGRRVVPSCWYVDAFLRQHPDYADLRADAP